MPPSLMPAHTCCGSSPNAALYSLCPPWICAILEDCILHHYTSAITQSHISKSGLPLKQSTFGDGCNIYGCPHSGNSTEGRGYTTSKWCPPKSDVPTITLQPGTRNMLSLGFPDPTRLRQFVEEPLTKHSRRRITLHA